MHTFLFVILFQGIVCDWVSEWLNPVEYQLKELSQHNISDTMQTVPNIHELEILEENKYMPLYGADVETFTLLAPESLTLKLEEILKTSKSLTTIIKNYITRIENKEKNLKEVIANGRSGTTILVVSTLAKAPRTYFIRNGFWTLCNGIVQYPNINKPYIFTELFSTPRCIGQEISSNKDTCAFNSIIKYETIPTTKRPTYAEDDYLCLKPTFNSTLETFMSVPRRLVDDTCKSGIIKSLSENILDCGLRVLLEYTYYPNRGQTSLLPLEYCTEDDGACKLIVGWHLSKRSIENFEFLKNDHDFKKFFIRNNVLVESLK